MRFALCLENPLNLLTEAAAPLFATCTGSRRAEVCDWSSWVLDCEALNRSVNNGFSEFGLTSKDVWLLFISSLWAPVEQQSLSYIPRTRIFSKGYFSQFLVPLLSLLPHNCCLGFNRGPKQWEGSGLLPRIEFWTDQHWDSGQLLPSQWLLLSAHFQETLAVEAQSWPPGTVSFEFLNQVFKTSQAQLPFIEQILDCFRLGHTSSEGQHSGLLDSKAHAFNTELYCSIILVGGPFGNNVFHFLCPSAAPVTFTTLNTCQAAPCPVGGLIWPDSIKFPEDCPMIYTSLVYIPRGLKGRYTLLVILEFSQSCPHSRTEAKVTWYPQQTMVGVPLSNSFQWE